MSFNLTADGTPKISLSFAGTWVEEPQNGEEARPSPQHYRMFVDDGGRGLATFNSSYEMVTAVRDAFKAMKTVYEEIGVLHRRICSRNISISHCGRGALVDWDFAGTNDSLGVTPLDERHGTWQFMSIRQSEATDIPIANTLQDDMESFLHVLNLVSLRYLPSNGSPGRLKSMVENTFNKRYTTHTGKMGGGHVKEMFLASKMIRHVDFKNPPLISLLVDLASVLAVRYQEPPSDQQIQKYKECCTKAPAETIDDWEGALVAGKYLRRRDRLNDATWMLQRLNEALAGRTNWPVGDKSSQLKRLERKHKARKHRNHEHLNGAREVLEKP
ncbi:hypothetical protein Hypma_008213 [Hypsizygus marmoreus]|uniref:Fungal-type protein kinase domain-containing protein n=1 Tax=Hypsizygus marmoreus TaxID=39966 RepID=A0A369JVN0_HYPMA|nr:hypothetical protein Hypma_008213 [Hypsizygus marmoreus]